MIYDFVCIYWVVLASSPTPATCRLVMFISAATILAILHHLNLLRAVFKTGSPFLHFTVNQNSCAAVSTFFSGLGTPVPPFDVAFKK